MENNDRLNISAGTRKLVYCALLTALGVVLGGMLSIPAMPLGFHKHRIIEILNRRRKGEPGQFQILPSGIKP